MGSGYAVNGVGWLPKITTWAALTLCLVGLRGPLARAQAPIPASPLEKAPPIRLQEQMVFLDGGGTNRVYLAPSSGHAAHLRNHRIQAWIPAPSLDGLALTAAVGHGHLWCPVIEGPPEKGRIALYRHPLETLQTGWERVASIETSHGIPSLLVPLDEDSFLGISNGLGFHGDTGSECSFVARFRLREDRLGFDTIVELPLPGESNGFMRVDHAYLGPNQKPATLRVCTPRCESTRPYLWPPSMSGEHLALAAPASDLVWILDLAKGRVRTTLSLLDLASSDRKRLNPLKDVILGTAFAPDGKLILATRHPELVDLTRRLMSGAEKSALPGGSNHGRDAETVQCEEEAHFKLLAEQQKTIQWWSWTPERPSAERLDPSTLFPDRVPTLKQQDRLRFLVDTHGSVRTNVQTPWRNLLEAFGIPPEPASEAKP